VLIRSRQKSGTGPQTSLRQTDSPFFRFPILQVGIDELQP
jgi:hypothetical protein